MRARWRWPCVSLALLLAYTVGSLLFLSPPRDPVGAITGASGASTTWAPRIRSAAGVDSIVFIALGPAARSASLLYALSSLREEGRWDGPVHVIVEREGDLDCLSSHLRSGVTTIAVVPPDGGDGGGGGGGGGGADDSDDGDETKAGTSDRKGELARKEERGSGGGGGGGRRRRGGGGGGVGGDGAGGNSAEGGGVAINAKLIKMQLFDLLPASVQRVVYVDCDVITQRPLGPYLAAVAREWGDVDEKAAAIVGAAVTVEEAATARVKNQEVAVLPAGASSSLRAQEGRAIEGPRLPPISFPPPAAEAAAADRPASRASPAAASAAAAAAAAGTKGGTAAAAAAAAADGVPSTLLIFPDTGGHTFPVCAGCDVAHSGVVALARGHSELCLQLWHDAFVGKTGGGGGSGGGVRGGGGVGGGGDNAGTATDQEALDIALRKGSGCEARWVDRGHLHFMKDLFVMAGLTRTSTFAHFTGLLHPERLSSFYRRHYEWSLGRSVDEWGQGEIRACAAGW